MIKNYNYGRFIADAIGSALAQASRDCEVIVFRDGPGDSSPGRKEVKAGSISGEMRIYLTGSSITQKPEAIARIARRAARQIFDLQRSVYS